MASSSYEALIGRVASRWLAASGMPEVSSARLPVALVASLRAGDVVVTESGGRWVVVNSDPRQVTFQTNQGLQVLTSREQGSFAWAYAAALLLIWKID